MRKEKERSLHPKKSSRNKGNNSTSSRTPINHHIVICSDSKQDFLQHTSSYIYLSIYLHLKETNIYFSFLYQAVESLIIRKLKRVKTNNFFFIFIASFVQIRVYRKANNLLSSLRTIAKLDQKCRYFETVKIKWPWEMLQTLRVNTIYYPQENIYVLFEYNYIFETFCSS